MLSGESTKHNLHLGQQLLQFQFHYVAAGTTSSTGTCQQQVKTKDSLTVNPWPSNS